MTRIQRIYKPSQFIQILAAHICLLSPLISATDRYTQLEEYVVFSPISKSESVLPNDHPFSSVYGYESGILDTPRNVTVISKTQLEAISLKDVRDFSKLTSSSYTSSNFGAPTTPSIRGQTADSLLNGMRKGLSNNGNGMPFNTNSVESVNILKGPPSVMVGASQYVGGYVDLISKRPTGYNEGRLDLTLDSEGMRKVQIDQNQVVSDTVSLRISLTGEDSSDYYWDDYRRQTTALYAALDWQPNDTYQLEILTEFFTANYTENWGINRPTDDLIDHLDYITGIGSTGGFLDHVTTTGTTKISRDARLHGEGDDSNGDYFTLQAIQTIRSSPDTTFVNNSLFQYRDRDTYSSYQYSEVLRDNFRFENRTEAQTNGQWLGLFHSLNLGLDLSYQDVWAVNDYYHEPANAWDLVNQSPANIGLSDTEVFYTAFFYNAFPMSGESARGKLSARPGSNSSTYKIDSTGETVQGNEDSNDSQTTSVGIFVQDDSELTDRLNLLIGGRIDYVYAQSKDPMFHDMIRYLENLNPTEDYSEVKQAEDSHGDFVPNFNLGLVYKLTASQRLYANFNYSESIPVDLGGGIALREDGQLDQDAFDAASQLFELGYKGTFYDGTLYTSINLFQQDRLEPQSLGSDQEVEVWGVETELHYQPTERFYMVFGYSYMESITRNGINAALTPISAVAANGGTYQYTSFAEFEGYDADTPGVPKHIINGLAAYQLTDSMSASIGFLVTSPMNLAFDVPASARVDDQQAVAPGDLKSAEIPWQYSIDLGLRYETEHWALAIYLLNATDEENWGSVTGLYGNDSIFAELPRRVEVTASLKW
ncbi:TonB-dependent receptor [Coraliomargarita algicola]|uniref:TonB-dependent receptor n=1 Tax=Coraliomargarita algicola TaxID=3092156 RepID=A0ABZ0RLH9_9BACT|nr:TonB-dependent receptor [Coraliomargarita sp. J2-16]WPJ95630.1 TonB-dependent receptor [Coraliomargarita sp. J2-16]